MHRWVVRGIVALWALCLAGSAAAQGQLCDVRALTGGRYLLISHWPQDAATMQLADRVCFFQPGVDGSDVCTEQPLTTTAGGTLFRFEERAYTANPCGIRPDVPLTQIAAVTVTPDRSRRNEYRAYAVNSAGRGATSLGSFIIGELTSPPSVPNAPVLLQALEQLAGEIGRASLLEQQAWERFARTIEAAQVPVPLGE